MIFLTQKCQYRNSCVLYVKQNEETKEVGLVLLDGCVENPHFGQDITKCLFHMCLIPVHQLPRGLTQLMQQRCVSSSQGIQATLLFGKSLWFVQKVQHCCFDQLEVAGSCVILWTDGHLESSELKKKTTLSE